MPEILLYDEDFFDESHHLVGEFINFLGKTSFLRAMRYISEGIGYGNDGGGFSFWEEEDVSDPWYTPPFDGVLFSMDYGFDEEADEVIVSYADMARYMEIACGRYAQRHPEYQAQLEGYIDTFKARFCQ